MTRSGHSGQLGLNWRNRSELHMIRVAIAVYIASGNDIMSCAWMRLSRSALLLSIVLSVMGCAVGPAPLPIFEPHSVSGPAATAVVLRDKQFCGSYPLNYLVVDDRPIAALAVGQHTTFQLSPGGHTLSVLHEVIDMPLLVGGGPAAVPVGVRYGRYGKAITQDFSADITYHFLVTSKCFNLDENEKVTIERVERWPEGITLDPREFVKAGTKAPNRQSGPNE